MVNKTIGDTPRGALLVALQNANLENIGRFTVVCTELLAPFYFELCEQQGNHEKHRKAFEERLEQLWTGSQAKERLPIGNLKDIQFPSVYLPRAIDAAVLLEVSEEIVFDRSRSGIAEAIENIAEAINDCTLGANADNDSLKYLSIVSRFRSSIVRLAFFAAAGQLLSIDRGLAASMAGRKV